MDKTFIFINTGKMVRLDSLLKSKDITGHNAIYIFDTNGNLLASGKWFYDSVLKYSDCWGIAVKREDNNNVAFCIQ